ncbi:hypothetical protein HS088_TW09G00403 [Tripterygium wilfordii]|uniref:Uncharacterized protein n=1 Tax=Tripterygium wilfordii TaxID=458696 RepID=A0A7J7D7T6_TRIWF|nr:uncharacterized protein At4g19900-like [Tripterygium wilfordii]XP_038711566.1 uncharacterized protein At4g19900-like [Tripterygium wilfordii]KAF5742358.1 hypothetical protein HS088_TW09G00403 [Tripterygium wilfordii]
MCAAISRLTLSTADTSRPHHREHDGVSDSRNEAFFFFYPKPPSLGLRRCLQFLYRRQDHELDTLGDQLQQENDNGLFDWEDDGEQISNNKVSSSGFYFYHISNAIVGPRISGRILMNGMMILSSLMWDWVQRIRVRLRLGSDDVPVDENVRRKVSEVEGIEEALMLKVDPLREGWGSGLTKKKGDFLRRDRMFKSNLEVLNALNNPLLQDPDGVGVSTLTRGDKVVQKWWLNVPFW